MYPFKQSQKGDTIIREFSSDVDSEELVWHRDRSDRYVKVLEGSGWYLQVDNQIPQKLIEGSVYFIPANNYHRVIRGKDSLVVSIKENKMKATRRQLRRIIKEELERVMNEAEGGSPIYGFDPDVFDQIPELVNKVIDARVSRYVKTSEGARALEIAKEKVGAELSRRFMQSSQAIGGLARVKSQESLQDSIIDQVVAEKIKELGQKAGYAAIRPVRREISNIAGTAVDILDYAESIGYRVEEFGNWAYSQ